MVVKKIQILHKDEKEKKAVEEKTTKERKKAFQKIKKCFECLKKFKNLNFGLNLYK